MPGVGARHYYNTRDGISHRSVQALVSTLVPNQFPIVSRSINSIDSNGTVVGTKRVWVVVQGMYSVTCCMRWQGNRRKQHDRHVVRNVL